MATEAAHSVRGKYGVRSATPSDVGYITRSWFKSYRKRSEDAQRTSYGVYREEHQERMRRLLKRSVVLVACYSADPSTILAFLVYEPTADGLCVHYAYTRNGFRREYGLGQELLRIARANCPGALQHSHRTDIGGVLAKKYGSTFNPYLAGDL